MKPARQQSTVRRAETGGLALRLRRAKGTMAGRLAGVLSGRLIAARLHALLVHHAAHGLYSEALMDEDGGEPSSAEYAARCEAATEALRELYAEFAIPDDMIPAKPETRREAASRLRRVLEHEERQALAVLDDLGPSRRIDRRGAPHDYSAAVEAEETLSHVASVLAYLDRTLPWTRPAPAGATANPDGRKDHSREAA